MLVGEPPRAVWVEVTAAMRSRFARADAVLVAPRRMIVSLS